MAEKSGKMTPWPQLRCANIATYLPPAFLVKTTFAAAVKQQHWQQLQ